MSANPPDGARRPRRDRRQALIDAAIALMSEGGDADISAAAISRRADVAHGLLFYYFTDKQGLVAAALADVLSRLVHHQSPRADEQTPEQRLDGFVRRHIEFLENHRTLYVRVVVEGVLGDPAVERALREARAAGARQVADIVGLGQPLTPVMQTAVVAWTGFLDRAADEYVERDDLSLDDVVDLVVRAFGVVTGH
ncbi:TetR family transcriptional regulator [Rhodococcus sp. BP-149]|jgi:AcrR family transcriptional regulator|uniref:TetR/AcrR family transcriptional regulator n=1 Tax=unclassified Rhodococcus (in: high G+C Gram-positive bacteria) TaxID=192944 RepID=UPI001C9AE7B7|nr:MULTISPECIES: TetR family transcriptional regulator [unclassified Rhodococcus (in: high G+C Gram-positive bacteria)]MBY6685477.1 TetR family transcriptional regulator [Rhodococcus sp. BP-288]MBY6694958.1 TetR family transcriptional regulator [Rhodococcus sp. BP-188]MBY6696821.1 TetR family transcriptional regulator [Rhodococcus sp. BP-285]MBY6703477.1 TetR family transcriptional regulator [Rhodococcus sp. BP-283]MBY6710569.1 TetR family transcriptional regulator [Rhodococcus sp. BP-160]